MILHQRKIFFQYSNYNSCISIYVASISFFFKENTTNDVFTEMDATQSRQFIIDNRRSIISPSAGASTPKINCSLFFTSPPSSNTSKMDRVRSSIASGGLSKYLGHVDLSITNRVSILLPEIIRPCSALIDVHLAHALSKILYIWGRVDPLLRSLSDTPVLRHFSASICRHRHL